MDHTEEDRLLRSEMTTEKLRQQFQGQLYKYTNVMKGWQYRWFILDPETGALSYFLNDGEHKQRPRGSIHLAGAVISPSDEDSNTFTVNSATGDMFKLRAADAKSRQEWVSRMRAVAEMHTMAIAQSNPPLSPREHHSLPAAANANTTSCPAVQQARVHCSLAVLDAFSTVREHIHRAEQSNFALARTIEELPASGLCTRSIDPDLLLMKATSQASLLCLGQCLFILQQQQVTPAVRATLAKKCSAPAVPSAGDSAVQPPPATVPLVEQTKKNWQLHETESSLPSMPLTPLACHDTDASSAVQWYSLDDDLTDEEDVEVSTSGPVEEHRSMIVHLLSQLKLGMDLTRVVLPTFILERRSLLELFADCMGHPDYFLRITDHVTAEARMLAVLEWYLTSFHMGRKTSVAKKPYNPIVGETFHCSWRIPSSEGANTTLWYTAEQVSHHPPVTAFYVECPDKQMCLNASIWTKSNFSGMSVGVNMIGDIVLTLGAHNEQYAFSLPAAYARSIINVPWIELGGKVMLTCKQSGYAANIVFHTKPFYGGKVNLVSAEVKDPDGENICKVQGEWNRHFEFIYENGRTDKVDVNTLTIFPKRVRRLSSQGEKESRKLWCDVTRALIHGDIELATEYKRNLEERQRMEERIRREQGTTFPTAYFHKVDDAWIYNNLLINI